MASVVVESCALVAGSHFLDGVVVPVMLERTVARPPSQVHHVDVFTRSGAVWPNRHTA